MDAEGKIVREAKVLSEPDALISWFAEYQVGMERIGLEAGPLSQWLYAAMGKAGLAVELLEIGIAHGESPPPRRWQATQPEEYQAKLERPLTVMSCV